jgi:Phage tail protein E.
MTKTPQTEPVTPRAGVVVLDEPLTRGDTRISELALRKPNSGELRGLSLVSLTQLDITALITLLPRITSPILTQAEAAQLSPQDLMQLGSEVLGFFMTAAERATVSESLDASRTPTPTSP